MSLTTEGELYLEHARRILGEIDNLAELLGGAQAQTSGLLRVNATLGFGRSHVAPAVSRFVRQHPQVEVQLQLSVNPPPLSGDTFDVCICFGAPPDSRVIARRLTRNRRLLCASPTYLALHGSPKQPKDLARHNCIGIRQGDEAYGLWRLATRRGKNRESEAVKTRGNLSTNDGEIAVSWALDGHGILMRAEWDIARYLRSGRLVQVLADYHTPDADIYAVYPQRHRLSARVRAFVDFMVECFPKTEPR
jgi:DNA-binding transcriptional LysR family regulator